MQYNPKELNYPFYEYFTPYRKLAQEPKHMVSHGIQYRLGNSRTMLKITSVTIKYNSFNRPSSRHVFKLRDP
jgi:hypothetical protein